MSLYILLAPSLRQPLKFSVPLSHHWLLLILSAKSHPWFPISSIQASDPKLSPVQTSFTTSISGYPPSISTSVSDALASVCHQLNLLSHPFQLLLHLGIFK